MDRYASLICAFLACSQFVRAAMAAGEGPEKPSDERRAPIAYSTDGRIAVFAPAFFDAALAVREAERAREILFEMLPLDRDAGLPVRIRIVRIGEARSWAFLFFSGTTKRTYRSSGDAEENRKALVNGIISASLAEGCGFGSDGRRDFQELPFWIRQGLTVLVSRRMAGGADRSGSEGVDPSEHDGIGSILSSRSVAPSAAVGLLEFLLRWEEGGENLCRFLEARSAGAADENALPKAFGFDSLDDLDLAWRDEDRRLRIRPSGRFFLSDRDAQAQLAKIAGPFHDAPDAAAGSGLWALYRERRNEETVQQKVSAKLVALLNLRIQVMKSSPLQKILNAYEKGLRSAFAGRWSGFRRHVRIAERRWKALLRENNHEDSSDKRRRHSRRRTRRSSGCRRGIR